MKKNIEEYRKDIDWQKSYLSEDGRLVTGLRKARIFDGSEDGEEILVGKISTKKLSKYIAGEIIQFKRWWWCGLRGLGAESGDGISRTVINFKGWRP